MNESDKRLQEQIETGNAAPGLEAEAYQMVFSALRKEPEFSLPANFATRVSSLAVSEKSFNWERFILIVGGIGFVSTLVYVIVSLKARFSFGAFTFLSNYHWLFFFGLTFILILNWIDRKLIHHAHGRS